MKRKKKARVVLVGRMNVGKSTLFNRLTETDRAITSSWAGTTRDVKEGSVSWKGQTFDIVDTGGLDVEDDEQLEARVIAATEHAIDDASLVLFVVDAKDGVLPQDKRLLLAVQKRAKAPIFLLVNKVDNATTQENMDDSIHQLPINPRFLVSSKNGRGTGELLDAIYETVNIRHDLDETEHATTVAIVGRPNVGKSSLLNSILGEERVIVADAAHTTRDTNDIPYSYKDRDFVLIDTAGLRRKANVGKRWGDKRLGDIERKSVSAAVDAVERADVVILVIEAQKSVSAQDKKIAMLAAERGKGVVVVVNKWDLVEEKDSNTIKEFADYFDAALPFIRWAPMVFISALDKLRVREVLDMVVHVTENFERSVDEAKLEEIVSRVRAGYKPRVGDTRKYRKRVVKFRSLTQIAIRPPRFYLSVSLPKDVPEAIVRIIERELRKEFDFEGVKIIIEVDK